MIEFREWPKTPRLNRDMIVTEKIDGTNAAIIVQRAGEWDRTGEVSECGTYITVIVNDEPVVVAAQSRKRVIMPGKQTDNAGFAGWVRENASELAALLGEGYHYGEWYGQAVQGNPHGLNSKAFRLFNVVRYAAIEDQIIGGVEFGLVPVLYEGPFSQPAIQNWVSLLRAQGSRLPGAEGTKAEGVIVFHKAAGHVYKVLCHNDELPKGVIPWQEQEANA